MVFLIHEYDSDPSPCPEVGDVFYRVTDRDAADKPQWYQETHSDKMEAALEKMVNPLIETFEVVDIDEFNDARLGPIAELQLDPVSPDHPKYKSGV